MNSPNNIMNLEPEQLGVVYTSHAKQYDAAFRDVANARWWARDAKTERGGVALGRATWRTLKAAGLPDNNAFARLLAQIASLVSTATQSWRPEPEPALPRPWRDEVTGELLRNPFAEPQDTNGQAVLWSRDRTLAEHLKRLAENPYQLVANLRDERTKREVLRTLKVGAAEFQNNPFRDRHAVQAQSDFISTHSETEVEVWRWETAFVVWPWSEGGNLTELGACVNLLKREPVADVLDHGVLMLAQTIDKHLLDAQRSEAAEAARVAAERAQQLERATATR